MSAEISFPRYVTWCRHCWPGCCGSGRSSRCGRRCLASTPSINSIFRPLEIFKANSQQRWKEEGIPFLDLSLSNISSCLPLSRTCKYQVRDLSCALTSALGRSISAGKWSGPQTPSCSRWYHWLSWHWLSSKSKQLEIHLQKGLNNKKY